MFIPVPNFFHPGSRVKKIPGSASKNLSIYLKKFFKAIGNMIRDVHPGIGILVFYPSRIQGSKRHRIPDP
jgi:hypothetical protein